MNDLKNRLEDGADRFLKHMYKQHYDGPPVLSIPHHDGNIDSLLLEARDLIETLEAQLHYAKETLREISGRRTYADDPWELAKTTLRHLETENENT